MLSENSEQLLREQISDLQRENTNLRCELEVFEGETSRRYTDVQILESESTELHTEIEHSKESLEMALAEKESLAMQMSELENGRISLLAELQECQMARDNSLLEIDTLRQKLTVLEEKQLPCSAEKSIPQQVQAEESKLSFSEIDDDDWGTEGQKVQDHMQQSGADNKEMSQEIDNLKLSLIEIEKEKNVASEELQASKVKCGKLLQKLKATQTKNESLLKEVEKLKGNKKGLMTDLDDAIEQEYKSQIDKANSECGELKQKLEEVIKEKDGIHKQCEVLKDAQDRMLAMKEDQDMQLRNYAAKNDSLAASVTTMEWRISELEEMVPNEGDEVQGSDAEQGTLKHRISSLETEIKELTTTNTEITSLNKDLNIRITELENSSIDLQREKHQMQPPSSSEKLLKSSPEDIDSYKDIYLALQQQVNSCHMPSKKKKKNLT